MSLRWEEKIFREKSLWDVYSKSRKIFPRKKFNRAVILIWIVCSIILTLSNYLFEFDNFQVQESANFVHLIADVGLTLSLSILGFLIAGFSIFASVTKTELFILLAEIPYKRESSDTGISRLQFIFFNFLNVFSVYLLLLSICLIIDLFFSLSSPLRILADSIASINPKFAHVGNCLVASIGGLVLIEALLQLKSFVWNLYQAVLLAIATDHELKKRDNNST